jgi:transcriptional regulator with XRE-family HTH domain
MTLGERVLILRRRLKMSQSELAKAAALDKNTIARLEQGRVKDLSGETVVRVARALQVRTDVLLGVEALDETGDGEPTELALAGREA